MNPFDSLSGLYDDHSLAGISPDEHELGFLKKIVKKVKKVAKSVGKEVKRSAKKVVKEVKRNPVAAGALVVAAGIALSPAAGAAAKAALAKGATAIKATKLATVAKTVKGGVQIKSAVDAAKVAKKAKNDAKKMAAEAKVAAKARAAIDAKTPQFQQLVNTLKAQGYTDKQIMDTWMQSQAYVDTTRAAVAQNYEGQIYSDLVSRGMSPQQANVMAPQYADQIGTQAAQQMQQTAASGGAVMPLLIGGGLILSMMV